MKTEEEYAADCKQQKVPERDPDTISLKKKR
jgi:hypothetical protein